MLRELERPRDEDGLVEQGFTWGYPGGMGPQTTGDAVLSDALLFTVCIRDKGDLKQLALDFCEDVIAHLPPQDQQWRMSWPTAL
ncbi:hypothetical protein LQ327_33335 [Actinomycetospora endophytica]|uniref:Uncharacterized protein n=1 Tax=Actinomycetospora endophytica TaxID=2291215 RepID=A0ABS8PLA5_9PSEU|nr:DUF6166 domain-containing protein [Actinomycetospora endophytica]MCD2198260.1 hypothetical protein [Actinomycetospora endophytica]